MGAAIVELHAAVSAPVKQSTHMLKLRHTAAVTARRDNKPALISRLATFRQTNSAKSRRYIESNSHGRKATLYLACGQQREEGDTGFPTRVKTGRSRHIARDHRAISFRCLASQDDVQFNNRVNSIALDNAIGFITHLRNTHESVFSFVFAIFVVLVAKLNSNL